MLMTLDENSEDTDLQLELSEIANDYQVENVKILYEFYQ